jgi:tetratricopeptide (TPR) repeat protein
VTAASEDRSDFFISYTQADRAWAEWIAWQLEAERYSTIVQAWHFRPGDNFVQRMRDALEQADRTIAVVSPSYLASQYGNDEWTAAFLHDPDGTGRRRLLPVQVEACALPRLLATLIYIDLVGVNRQTAKARLLEGVRRGSVVPIEEPGFPGGRAPRLGHSRGEPRFPGNVPEISNLPPRNPNFTGRNRLFDELHTKLQPGSPAIVAQAQAVHGMGGVGKTQLALEYAHRRGADYDLVWWVSAGEPLAVPTQLVVLARRLGIPEAADQAETISALQDELRRYNRWLLVFDNAEEPAGLWPWWPPDSGRVIVTTRNPAWSAVANTIGVDVLSRTESVAFLRRRTRMNSKHARALAEALGDLPLALEQAAAYIDQTSTTATDYVELLDRYGPESLGRDPPLDYEYTVTNTWAISVDRLRQQAPAAIELLTLCAFLAPDGVPRALLADYLDQLPPTLASVMAKPLDRNQVIGALRRYSLITVTGAALRVHRLVQAVTRHGLAAEEQQRWADAALRLILAAFPEESDDPDTWPISAPLLTHALQVITYADSGGEEYQTDREASVRLTIRVGDYLESRAEYQRALHLLQRNVAAAEAGLGSEHLITAQSLASLAIVLWDLRDVDNAHALFQRALAIDEQQLDPDDPTVAQILNGFALVLVDQGDLDGARVFQERALAIYERRLGPDHPRTAWTLSNLGTVLASMGDTEGARMCYERALSIRKRCLGPNHPSTHCP